MSPLPEGPTNPVPDHRSSKTLRFDYQLDDGKIYIRSREPGDPKKFVFGDIHSTKGDPDALEWTLFNGTGIPCDKNGHSMLAPDEELVEISVASEIVVAVSNRDRVYLFKPTDPVRPTRWEDRLGAPDFFIGEVFLPSNRRSWAFSCSVRTKPEIRTTEFMHHREIVHYFSDAKGRHFDFGFTATLYVLTSDGSKVVFWDTGLPPSFSRGFLVPEGTQGQCISAAGSTIFLSAIDSTGRVRYFTLDSCDYETLGCCPGLKNTYLDAPPLDEPGSSSNESFPLGFGTRCSPLNGWTEHSVDEILPYITQKVCIRLVGQGDKARILRIQGNHPELGEGYYFKKIAETRWRFRADKAVTPVGPLFPFDPLLPSTLRLSYDEKPTYTGALLGAGIFHHHKKRSNITLKIEGFHPFLMDAEPCYLVVRYPGEPPQHLRIHVADGWNLHSNPKHDEELVGTIDGEPKSLVGTLVFTPEQLALAQNESSNLGRYLKTHFLDYHGQTKAMSIIADNHMVILKLGHTECHFERNVSDEEIAYSFYVKKANENELCIAPADAQECRALIAKNKACLKEIHSIASSRQLRNAEFFAIDFRAGLLRPIVSRIFDCVKPADPTYQQALKDLELLFETSKEALMYALRTKGPRLGYEAAIAILTARINERKDELREMMTEESKHSLGSF